MKKTVLISALWLRLQPLAGKPAPPPQNLSAGPLDNALGLPVSDYLFSWEDSTPLAGQVLVASDEAKLAGGVGDLWDSGKRELGERTGLLGQGLSLQPGQATWWKARFWIGEEPGEWSESVRLQIPSIQENGRNSVRPTTLGGEARFVAGKIGQGISLGSATLEARDYESLRSPSGTTLAAWVKIDKVTDSWQCIYRKEDGARRLLAVGKDGPFWGVWCGFYVNGRYVEFGAPFDRKVLGEGRWQHLAATHDGKELVLWVDGNPIGRQPALGELGSGDASPAGIGSYQGNRERFQGAIDDLRIYDRGLSTEEVTQLASADPKAVSQGLVGHWPFDESVENAVTYLSEEQGERIVLLGGSLVYGMEAHGYFESAVTSRWPGRNLTFRNIGWPADDVFGTARGEFGSARNTRSWQPPGAEAGFGFTKMRVHLAEANPTVLIVGYGGEAAYADSDEKMNAFETGYVRLIDELEKTGARLILLTPIPQKHWPLTLSDPGPGNERLRQAGDFILRLAKMRKHLGIDLFSPKGGYE